MYNLTVEGVHTYYAGSSYASISNSGTSNSGTSFSASFVLVHNKNCLKGIPPQLHRRVKLRKSTKEAIRATSTKRGPKGEYYNAVTKEMIPLGEEHFGHIPDAKWSTYQQNPENHGKTRQQIIEEQNDPANYQMEWSVNNVGHKNE